MERTEGNNKEQKSIKLKREKQQKSKETKSWFSEKINQINKEKMRKKGKNGKITNIRNETGDITTHPAEIRRVIREYYKYSVHIYLTTQTKWTNSQKHR